MAESKVQEVDIAVPSGTVSLALGRWGPYTAEGGKVRIPVDAIPAFLTNGYHIIDNDLGRAYRQMREAEREQRVRAVPHTVLGVRPESTTPPLAKRIVEETVATLESATEAEVVEEREEAKAEARAARAKKGEGR